MNSYVESKEFKWTISATWQYLNALFIVIVLQLAGGLYGWLFGRLVGWLAINIVKQIQFVH